MGWLTTARIHSSTSLYLPCGAFSRSSRASHFSMNPSSLYALLVLITVMVYSPLICSSVTNVAKPNEVLGCMNPPSLSVAVYCQGEASQDTSRMQVNGYGAWCGPVHVSSHSGLTGRVRIIDSD